MAFDVLNAGAIGFLLRERSQRYAMKSDDERNQDDKKAPEAAKRMVFPLSTQGRNVGDTERIGSALIGAVLVLLGLKQRSLGGAVQALVGGLLVARGVTGHSRPYQWFGLNTAGTEAPRNNGERLPGAPQATASLPAKAADPTEAVANITVGRDAAELRPVDATRDGRANAPKFRSGGSGRGGRVEMESAFAPR